MLKENSRYEILTPSGFRDFTGVQKLQKSVIRFVCGDVSCRVAQNHPFVIDGISRIADDMVIGDFLSHSKLGNIPITDIIRYDDIVDVYEPLNVDGGNVYYGDDILHHNCNFLGSESTLLTETVLKKLLNQDNYDPIQYLGKNDNIRVYENPEIGVQYVIGCLPVGEGVITDSGYKEVQDVMINDKLVDIDGDYTDIDNIQIYKDVEDNIFDVSVYGGFRSTSFTSEHPIYCSHAPEMKRVRGGDRYRDFDFNYDEVKNLKVDDWVRYPNIYKDKPLSDRDILNKWGCIDKTRCDFMVDNPLLDKEFWWFVGIWLGDGWIQTYGDCYGIHTCHNMTTEQHYVDRIKRLFDRYNRTVTVVNRTNNNTIECFISSKEIHSFLFKTFGKYAGGKYISEWVKYLPDDKKVGIVRGYMDSDGCSFVSSTGLTMSMVSISLNLIEGIQDILLSLGLLPSLGLLRKCGSHIICGKVCDIKETYNLILHNYDSIKLSGMIDYDTKGCGSRKSRNKRYCYFGDNNDFIYYRIKNIDVSPYRGDVYNFETKSHSFLSRYIPTHNCDVAKGTGEHYSTIQVFRIDSVKPVQMDQVCVYESNMTDVYEFSGIVDRIATTYNNAYIMCENNAEGSTVVNQLWWEYENENLVCEGTKSTKLGVRATTKTKPIANLLMKKLIEDGSIKIRDYRTIQQFLTFLDMGNNRFGGNGNDDDLISAFYWACYFFTFDLLEDSMTFKNQRDDEEDDTWGIFGADSDENEGYEVLRK